MNAAILPQLVISTLILIYLWYQLSKLRRDELRTDIRTVRDGLFDFMCQNSYSFDDESYRATRRMCNGLLRMSNLLSIPRVFLVIWANRHKLDTSSTNKRRKQGAAAAIEQRMTEAKLELAMRLIRFMFMEGLTGVFVRLLLAVFGLFRQAYKLESWSTKQGQTLVQEAYVFGDPQLSPTKRHLLHC